MSLATQSLRFPRPLQAFLCILVLVGIARSQAPPTFTQALLAHHIEITPPALLAALRNPDKSVRGLAAAELAALKIHTALPEILHAAAVETDGLTKINIAKAATWLDSEEGLHILKNICSDASVASPLRIQAARSVFDKQSHACFSDLVAMMPSADREAQIGILSVLSQVHPNTMEEADFVLASALKALHEEDIGVRLEGCEALRWLRDPRAITPLRDAIPHERDEAVREQMRFVLGQLEKEQARP